MSIKIKQSDVDEKTRVKLYNDLVIDIETKFGNFTQVKQIYPFDVTDNHIYIPFAYGKKSKYKRPPRNTFSKVNVNFSGTLRDPQKELENESIQKINKYGSVLISAYVGFGKSCTSLSLTTKIGLKTMIIVHRVVLMKQWKESIHKFCPGAKVQIVQSKDVLDSDCDYYIMNAINVPKKEREEYKDIGVVLVDECHLIMSGVFSKCMNFLVPRCVIGLSATPYRPDGLNQLFDLYFGKSRIHRKLWRKHTVYKVLTKFVPKVEMNVQGKLNWNSVLNSVAESKERNQLIVDIVMKHSDRVFLVLCKRISQATYLYDELVSLLGEKEVSILVGKEQEFDRESRVLIGTTSKCSVGFDHPRLDTLLLASDIQEYYIQSLGRIMRRKDNDPVVFDLVDELPTLKRHYYTRRKVYMEHGGEIKNYKVKI